MRMHLVDDAGERWRIVVDAAPQSGRRLFEAMVPKDATVIELMSFCDEVTEIVQRRRRSEETTTSGPTPGKAKP